VGQPGVGPKEPIIDCNVLDYSLRAFALRYGNRNYSSVVWSAGRHPGAAFQHALILKFIAFADHKSQQQALKIEMTPGNLPED